MSYVYELCDALESIFSPILHSVKSTRCDNNALLKKIMNDIDKTDLNFCYFHTTQNTHFVPHVVLYDHHEINITKHML